MGNNIVKALHVGISVKNMDEALEWYKKNLGFEIEKDDYVPPLKARIVFIEKDGFEIELFQYDDPKPIPEDRLTPNTDLQTIGTKHAAFETDDMQALKKRFLENGVDIAHEATMDGESVMFVRDNSGVLLEFIQKV
jgi:methylmalonyl-CoA/ethylmalonyl-CoA epimerase